MSEDEENKAVVGFVETLKEHRKSCEKQGKYIEAEIAKNRLEELKFHEDARRKVSVNWQRRCFLDQQNWL